jgi:hypothetical protein
MADNRLADEDLGVMAEAATDQIIPHFSTTHDDPRPEPEVVSESAHQTSTPPVIVPCGSFARSDHRGLGS